MRLLIVSIGLVFFHIMYRVGDPATRRKVLWFLDVSVAALVVGLLGDAVHAALHGNSTPAVRVTVLMLIPFRGFIAWKHAVIFGPEVAGLEKCGASLCSLRWRGGPCVP